MTSVKCMLNADLLSVAAFKSQAVCQRPALVSTETSRTPKSGRRPDTFPQVICPSCGQENPAGFRLCGMCGTPLTESASAREERKVLTVLFADLVGFTSRAEEMDPED